MDSKMRLFYPPRIRGHWRQNKWNVGPLLSGRAAKAGDAVRYPCNFWWLRFSAGHSPSDGRVTAARGSNFHCSQSVTSKQPWPQPCWPQGVEVGTMQDYDYRAKVWDIDDLKQRLIDVWDSRHRRRDRPMAFTWPCPCKRGAFWICFVTCIWTSS